MNNKIFLMNYRKARPIKARKLCRCCNMLNCKAKHKARKTLTKVSTYTGLCKPLHGTFLPLKAVEVVL